MRAGRRRGGRWWCADRPAFGPAAGRAAGDGERARGPRASRPRRPGRPGLRLARAFDAADPPVAARSRGRAVAKFLNNKRCPQAGSTRRWSAWAVRATSRRGPMPLLYREAPLNSIWEGSGNVNALDVAARARDASPSQRTRSLAEVRARARRGPAPRRRGRRGSSTMLAEPEDASRSRAGSPRAARRVAAGLASRPSWRTGGRGRLLCLAARPAGRGLRHAALLARLRRDRRTPPAADLRLRGRVGPGRVPAWPSRSSTAPSEVATTARAASLAAVLNANGIPATIAAGRKSQFDVLADGELLFSKQQQGRFPEEEEILALVK